MKHVHTTTSSDETEALAATLAADLQGKIVLLQGNLGAGKTTFVRGLARGLGLKDRVQSPTFAYERIYSKGSAVLRHFDLYRAAESGDSLLEEELYELFTASSDTIVIEWPERLQQLPHTLVKREVVTITFTPLDSDKRTITVERVHSEKLSSDEINKLYAEYHTPLHVQRHCRAVADFALKLAKLLIQKGIAVDAILVEQAALLHDLVRYIDFKSFDPVSWGYPVSETEIDYWQHMRATYEGRHHADVGADIIEAFGLIKTATIIRKHKFSAIANGLDSWEEKLVYYADKRAKHDTIVPLTERLEDGKKRNAPHLLNDEKSKMLDAQVHMLEQEIFELIGTTH